jgi:hypothetical protein
MLEMATEKQRTAARRNLERARGAQSARAHGRPVPGRSQGISIQEENRMADQEFAFPEQRKEPIHDARHVRNAIARFDQVEDVSDRDRDAAWKRIRAAARKFDVEVAADDWRELMKGGRTGRRS